MFSWMNDNQGAIMGILTLVYVVATLAICYYNNKSARVATQQLEAMKDSQIQNIRLSLFDRRFEIYLTLKKWCDIAERTFDKNMIDPRTQNRMEKVEVFRAETINNTEYKEMEDLFHKINDLRTISGDKTLNQIELNKLIKQQQLYLPFRIYGKVKNELLKAKFLFSTTYYEQIEKFADAFFNAVICMDEIYIKLLEHSFSELKQANVLHKMEEQLKLRFDKRFG